MATLYWGGGTGTWDGFTTGNWYTDFARTTLSTRAPSAEDDVVFDSVSNATDYTVTIANNTTVCRNVTIAGPASGNLTLAGTGTWYVYGNFTLPATGLTRTFTGTILLYGTGSHTITSNGVSFNSLIAVRGIGTYTLQDALTTSNTIQINSGTLDTNGKNLTCGQISSLGTAATGTLKLGSSTVSATNFGPSALNLDAGTSNITLSAVNASIGGGSNYTGNTFYNVTFSSAAITTSNFYGNNTFNNLTFTTPAAARISNVRLFGNQTVNGTLTIAGADGAKRYFVQSDTIGTTRTLTVATVASLVDVDFRDITVAGASSPWSGTRLGNCLGNTNITFGAGANKYIAASTDSNDWYANIWATSSGGSASPANFPLAQDTVIIDNAGLITNATFAFLVAYNIGSIDASSRTNAMTFFGGASPSCYGDINVSTNVTSTISGTWTYAGRTTQNITTNGRTWGELTVDSPSGTVKYLDNYTGTARAITLTNGTLDFNDKNITCVFISATGTAPKTLTLGSGTITTTNGIGTSGGVSNLTVTSNTATITSSTSTTIIGYPSITATFGGTFTVNGAATAINVYGTTTIGNLTIGNAPTTTSVTNKLVLAGDLTITGTLALAGGTSVTQRMGIASSTVGTQRTITAATVTGLSDIDFQDIAVTGASAPWSGTRLGNCQGNSGITFASGVNKYWNLTGTQNWSATAWATSSGGTPDVNNFPLAQDTAVFDDTGAATTVTLDAAWNIGTINASARTSAMTLAGTGGINIYGNVTYGSGITSTASTNWAFRGAATQTFTTAGKTLANPIQINNPSCVFQHGDAYTSTSTITITSGSYSTQNYNVTCNIFSSNITAGTARTINLGTSTLTISGSNTIIFTNSTGLTFIGSASTINLSATTLKTFNGGSQTFGTVNVTGGTTANIFTITGSNTFGTLSNSAYNYMIWAAGTTQTITNFTYTGASGNVVRWYTSIAGQQATLKQSSTGGSLAAVGTNSVDGGNNSALTFTGTSPDYYYVKDIAYSAYTPPTSGGNTNFFAFF